MNLLSWEPTTHRLLLPEHLWARLSYPHRLCLVARADGLVGIDPDLLQELPRTSVTAAVRTPPGDDADDPAPPHLLFTAEEARRLLLPPARLDYRCWVDADALYAVPIAPPALPARSPAAAEEVAVTLGLRTLEVQLLEALALHHHVRLADILTAFAADLAGAQARSHQQQAQLRSGGSDERDHAQQWFARNVMPASAAWMEGAEGPVFLPGAHRYRHHHGG